MLEGGLVASGVKRLLAVAEHLRDPFELVQESQFAVVVGYGTTRVKNLRPRVIGRQRNPLLPSGLFGAAQCRLSLPPTTTPISGDPETRPGIPADVPNAASEPRLVNVRVG
jgi:hypothetical protein